MAIELLDLKKQWAKIKSGFSGGNMFRNPVPPQRHRFVDGRAPTARESAEMNSSTPKSAFTGQTYNNRKK